MRRCGEFCAIRDAGCGARETSSRAVAGIGWTTGRETTRSDAVDTGACGATKASAKLVWRTGAGAASGPGAKATVAAGLGGGAGRVAAGRRGECEFGAIRDAVCGARETSSRAWAGIGGATGRENTRSDAVDTGACGATKAWAKLVWRTGAGAASGTGAKATVAAGLTAASSAPSATLAADRNSVV